VLAEALPGDAGEGLLIELSVPEERFGSSSSAAGLRRMELRPSRQAKFRARDPRGILQDNVKGRRLSPDGSYKRRRPAKGEEAYRSQIELHRETKRALDRVRAGASVTFEPLRSPSE
jgi:hypothetical protein